MEIIFVEIMACLFILNKGPYRIICIFNPLIKSLMVY